MMQIHARDFVRQGFIESDVGPRLDAVRREKKLTQVRMCEVMGISRTSYMNYCKDKRELPLSLAKLVIQHFDLDAEWFLFGTKGRRNNFEKGA